MTVIRVYRALIWLSNRLPDPYGRDLDGWCLMRMFRYTRRVEQATGFTSVQVTGPPPAGNLSAATTITRTWP